MPPQAAPHAKSQMKAARAHDEVIRRALEEILCSPQFSTSRRCSALLRHVVEHALTGDDRALTGRLLGIEIFRRPSDYDTGSDAIVRVTANDVRRRLASFYSSHPTQPMHIRLPLGSYIPVLDSRAVARPLPGAQRASNDLRLR